VVWVPTTRCLLPVAMCLPTEGLRPAQVLWEVAHTQCIWIFCYTHAPHWEFCWKGSPTTHTPPPTPLSSSLIMYVSCICSAMYQKKISVCL